MLSNWTGLKSFFFGKELKSLNSVVKGYKHDNSDNMVCSGATTLSFIF